MQAQPAIELKAAPWPPDVRAETVRRLTLLDKIRHDPQLLAAALKHYATSPADFIGDWIWTYDPRRKPAHIPLVLWPRQREFTEWLLGKLQAQDDGLVEKSRDMGVTWLCVSFALWAWRFVPGFKAAFGSRKEALVDKLGDPDAIFEKLRYALDRIPPVLLPEGFNRDLHCAFLKLTNPETGGAITGEAGDNIGRGGRNTMYFKDESAFYERPQRIEAALSQNTDVQIDVSTPNGVGNPFYVKRMSYPAEKVFVFDWRQDPRKDQAWYERQRERLDPVILAQEVDRDYAASMEGVCIPGRWVRAALDFPLKPMGQRAAGLDVADEGADANAFAYRHGAVVLDLAEWKEGNTTQTARRAFALARDRDCDELRYDSIGVGAGVKGELASGQLPLGRLQPYGINVGKTDLKGYYLPPSDDDPKGKKNADMFLNLKAQAWWELRRRFERTWEVREGLKNHPHDDLISLPAAHPLTQQLVMELSQPKYEHTETGKIKIESKKHMKEVRGLRSPNLAEALMLCFCPVHSYKLVW